MNILLEKALFFSYVFLNFEKFLKVPFYGTLLDDCPCGCRKCTKFNYSTSKPRSTYYLECEKKKKISLAVVFYRVPFIVIMILYIHYDFIQKLLYPGSKELFEPQIGRLERLTTPRHGNDPRYPRF